MVEIFNDFIVYVPVALFFAAIIDIFFLTGLLFYGGTTLGAIGLLYSSGAIGFGEIVIATYAGTLLGNSVNFYSGRLFGETPVVARKLSNPKVQKAQQFLRTRGLFLYILIGRFTAVTRPLYALLLGSLQIKYRRFIIYEACIALFWVVLWLLIVTNSIDFIKTLIV